MATYSYQDLFDAVTAAGGSAAAADVLAAIALAESGGRSDAVGDTGIVVDGVRSRSVGPWQINLPYHPDVTEGCAMDLNCAAAAALRISNGGTNFNAWTTYTEGIYKGFLKGAGLVAQDVGSLPQAVGAGASGAGQQVAGLFSLPSLSDPLASVQAAITSSVSKALYFFAGVTLLALGILLLVVSTLPRPRADQVLEATPAGAVAKAVSG